MLHRFRHAIHGISYALARDRSVRLHFVVAFAVVVSATLACLSAADWALLFLVTSFVIVTELINSSIEHFANHVHPEQHEAIKRIKDLAAGAVLVASFSAFVVGLLIFLPPLLNRTAGYCIF